MKLADIVSAIESESPLYWRKSQVVPVAVRVDRRGFIDGHVAKDGVRIRALIDSGARITVHQSELRPAA